MADEASQHDELIELSPTAAAVRALHIRSGRKVREAAEAGGFASMNSYTHYYSARFKKKYLPQEAAEMIARALAGHGNPPITEAEVMALAGNPAMGTSREGAALLPNVRKAPDAPTVPAIYEMRRSLPVRGGAEGGPDGAFQLNMAERPLDIIPCPPGLAGVKDAFALYVEGESMIPWKEPGEIIYIHPTRPPHVGSYVVVEFIGDEPGRPPSAMVKRLVRRSASYVELEQYNPPKRFSIAMDKVHRIYRVLTMEELLGSG